MFLTPRLAPRLTPRHRMALQAIVYDAFLKADTDRDGNIDQKEMRQLLHSLHFPPNFIEEAYSTATVPPHTSDNPS